MAQDGAFAGVEGNHHAHLQAVFGHMPQTQFPERAGIAFVTAAGDLPPLD